MLEKFLQLAISAHNGTSFSPEKRGASYVKDYGEELEKDMQDLQVAGVDAETIQGYVERFERYFGNWMGAKSRCISSMITGPSNFPTRRAEKANRSEENNYAVFREWRRKAKKAITRKAGPEVTFLSEIDRYKKDLEQREKNQELMKRMNEGVRKFKSGKSLDGYTEREAELIRNWKPAYSYIKKPYTYQLTNNLANIKRIQERIQEMEKKETQATEIGQMEYPFTGGVVVVNYADDRIQIKHDQKPPREVLQDLKSNGFHWSPFNVAWQRKITWEAIGKTNYLTGVNIPRK